LLGDFSGNEQVPMGGKSSTSKLQERQQLVLYGGNPITIRVPNTKAVLYRRSCTTGFAVRRPKGEGAFNQGYLMAGSCVPSRTGANRFEAFVYDENGNEVIVGSVSGVERSYNPSQGLDYSVVRLRNNY